MMSEEVKDLAALVDEQCVRAKAASQALLGLSAQARTVAIESMADAIDAARAGIIAANAKDLTQAHEQKLPSALLDRLKLDEARITGIVNALRSIAQLPDALGETLETIERENGLRIEKRRVPIGVIAMIYESRPNVTADVAALCIKTGNAVILRGGKEARHSNLALHQAICQGLTKANHPHSVVYLVQSEHAAIDHLVQNTANVDLVIPRGGERLIEAVAQKATVPVIKHYKGLCHIYVDKAADLAMAKAIVHNAKCQRPGVCNAVETVLVHVDIAQSFCKEMVADLLENDVECRMDVNLQAYVPGTMLADESDWHAEYLDRTLSFKSVESTEVAIEHINHYGSHHSDAIISVDAQAQAQFLQDVDSAVVYVNASTRFTDGAEFGFGAEIGISTDKLHARGPMGLRELTTYKYLVYGTGQVRNN